MVPEAGVNKNPLRRFFTLRASLRSLKLLCNLANRHGVATKGFYNLKNGARGRTWTGTVLPPRDFKSLASTNFATRAEYLQQAGKAFGLSWMIRRSYNKTI